MEPPCSYLEIFGADPLARLHDLRPHRGPHWEGVGVDAKEAGL